VTAVSGAQTRQADDGQVGVQLDVVAVHPRAHDHAHVARIGVDRLEVGGVLREIELLELDRHGARVLERRGFNFEIAVFRNTRGNRAVHSIRVNIADDRVLLLVNVLAPHQHPQF